jgi:hypothetical protein
MAFVETSFFSDATSEKHRTISLPNGKSYIVKPNQIVIWLSITPKLPPNSRPALEVPVFPAILDTGCNTSLSMTEEQFDYARLPSEERYVFLRSTTVNGEPACIVSADAWLYRQASSKHVGTYEISNPLRLSLREGVRVRTKDAGAAPSQRRKWFGGRRRQAAVAWSQPLPTLGLEVFPVNSLGMQMDGFPRKVRILLQPKGRS